ncbi:VanZ family protein [Paenibacillus silagei]|uniref:Glycopeptide antibiotics resistance protein n=1 Tax=Paenibacillus silagei TaxID=1670801 RepID=A0ABS4NPC8_9BACL|nr:VanZ family protein [Paenibacillus silagei]MBP2111914.1 glycopeptide antibiotics resistance protein [Paenibacillus silagei]
MFEGKKRTAVWIGLGLYTILTLFFLFAGFNRSSALPETGLRYQLTFDGIPLHFPGGGYLNLWVFNLGNYLAFVPFGLVIPLLIRCRFLPFLLVFLAAITGIELIQMVTRLGAFDINDIVINTLGAAVGYGAQRLIRRDRTTPRGVLKLLSSGAILTLIVYSAVSGINYYLDHGRGEIRALDQLPLEHGEVQWEQGLHSFTMAQEQIEPAVNLYSPDHPGLHEFSIRLDGQYKELAGNFGVPDDAMPAKGSGTSSVMISADGEELYSLDVNIAPGENQPLSFQVPLEGKQELTLTIKTDAADPRTHAVLWDLTLVEANAGQKLATRLQRLLGGG